MNKMSSGNKQCTCAVQGSGQFWRKGLSESGWHSCQADEEILRKHGLLGLRSRKKELKNDLSKAILRYGHMEGPTEGTEGETLEAAAVSCASLNSSLPEDSGRRTSRVKGETKRQHRGYPDESLEGKFHESRNFQNHCTPRSWLYNRHFIKIQGCSISVQMSLTFAQCSCLRVGVRERNDFQY